MQATVMYLSKELIDAAHLGDIDRIRQLAAEGHDLSLPDDGDGEDLLWHFIWQCGDLAKIKHYLSSAVSRQNRPCKGGAPLIGAVWWREPEAGSDPNVVGFSDERKMTALDAALDDCTCDTPEEMQAMEKIEALIREAGGRQHG